MLVPVDRSHIRLAALVGLILGILFVWVRPSSGLDDIATAPPGEIRVGPLNPRAVAPAPMAERALAVSTTAATRWAIPADEIDVRRATVVDDTLVQSLPDGTAIEFTLDPMLQRAALRSLEKYEVDYGVVVAIRPKTGEILAMAEHAHLRPDLRHLALQAEGPAASLFKIVSAAALLEFSDLTPETTSCTHGGRRGLTLYHLQPREKKDRHCETFAEALGASNNVAFARWTDAHLRPAQLQSVAERFLFNRRLPSLWGVAVSRAKIPSGSRLGFARSAAGFEGTTLSPLHAALIAAAIANDGTMMAPRLVRAATRGDEQLYRYEPASLGEVVTPEVARTLTRMMVSTTTTGTGKKFFEKRGKRRLPGVDIAGKTGSLTARDTGVARHYSWFVAMAPAEDPEIAIASLVINGEQWTVKGIVPARELLSAYFGRKATGPAR